jgi:hypothetical protein
MILGPQIPPISTDPRHGTDVCGVALDQYGLHGLQTRRASLGGPMIQRCFQKQNITTKTGRQEEKLKTSASAFLRGLPVFVVRAVFLIS